jgi:ABC-type nitrate/sulfonate/bicarbonate transport system substrate-binding protein
VRLEVVPIGSGPGLVQALLGGSLDVVMMSPESIVNASQRGGASLVTVMGVQSIPLMELHAAPGIRQIGDLRGKQVGVSNQRSQDGLCARLLLRHAGVRDDEYDFVTVGGTAQRYAALKAGGVEATMLSSPVTYTSRDEGAVVLGQIADVLDHFQFLGYHTRREWAQGHRAALVGLLRGVEQGRQFVLEPANQAAAIATLVEAAGVGETEARRTYDEMQQYARYFTPTLDVEGYRLMMQYLQERGDIDRVDDPVNNDDHSYLREALSQP